jgi:hypothetical protein
MATNKRVYAIISGIILAVLALGGSTAPLGAKDKGSSVNPNDPTYRLFSLLDSKYNGKLDDFCMLADLVNDPKNPGQQLQRLIRLEYNKDRGFGKLSIHVRTVAPLTPDQVKAYTPKQTFDFAESDTAKFTKTDPGAFGKPGDVYFEASPDGGPLTTVSASDEVQAQYDLLVTQYLLPALEKKAADGSGT